MVEFRKVDADTVKYQWRFEEDDRRVFSGLTREEWDVFNDEEEERLKDDVPPLRLLGLSNRLNITLIRTGARTVEGVEQILGRGVKIYHIDRSLPKIQAAIDVYRQEHPLER